MRDDDFTGYLREMVTQGQRRLADTARALVYKADPDLFEVQSEAGDEAFLEPMIFAYFHAGEPRIGLPQIVLGYVDESIRPDTIEVYADARGRVYLPRIGYFLTDVRDRQLELSWERETGRYALHDGGLAVDFRFEEPLRVSGTAIEICRHTNPLFNAIDHGGGDRSSLAVEEDVERYAGHLARALAILAERCPDYHRVLTSVTRQVVVFQSDRLNSFAGASAHGVAFLNRTGDDEVFFLEDIVHQCGHVMFTAVTVDRSRFLAIDPEATVDSVVAVERDLRSVYGFLHGAFTEYEMIRCLDSCLEADVFSGRRRHELIGRLACIFQKNWADLDYHLDEKGVFTEEGLRLYGIFRESLEGLRRRRPELLYFDMSNQPYSFSYEKFAQLNPIHVPRPGAAMAW
jgi:hypothetical protein